MTTNDAALAAHCTRQAIQQAIKRGKLPACKIGRDWQIDSKDFDAWLSSPRKVGRPKKEKRE
jgi:excisionase family DNA binding protein